MEATQSLTLLLTLLSTTTSIIATPSSSSCAAVAFIKSTCNSTTYPDLCGAICLPYSVEIKCDLQMMSNYALKAALGAAKNSSNTVLMISKEQGLESSKKAAIRDCVDLVKDSVVQIQQSLGELVGLKNASNVEDKKFKLSNIQTWMSAALTDYQTCLDGLDEQDAGSQIRNRIMHSIRYSSMRSSNSLAIINKIE